MYCDGEDDDVVHEKTEHNDTTIRSESNKRESFKDKFCLFIPSEVNRVII